MPIGLGTLLNDRYLVEEELGGGGFGTVWRCQDGGLKRDVAIKVLARHDQESLDRFRREAVILARLSHPAIVTVHDIGAHDGHPFIVMELLDGTDLGKFISWHRRGMEIHEILDLAILAAEALTYAHSRGVLHRDIKPGNLIVTGARRARGLKICDFGISRLADATRTLTAPGGLIGGTPAYASPEQWSGTADARSDLYSFGCVLYEMLTGHPLFTADNLMTLLFKHINTTPEPPESIEAIPPELSALVLQLLAKNPQDRPATAAAVVADLQKVQRAWGAATGDPTSVSFDPQGEYLAVVRSGSTHATIWHISSKTEARHLDGHVGTVRAVAWAPDGQHIATASYDGLVRAWDAATGQSSVVLSCGDGVPGLLAWAPDSRRLAIGQRAHDSVVVWDTLDEAGNWAFSCQDTDVRGLAWSPDGRFLTVSPSYDDRGVQIWDTTTRLQAGSVPAYGHEGNFSAAWSPDGRFLAVGVESTIQVLDAESHQVLHASKLEGRGRVRSVAWSPDSRRIAIGTDRKRIQIWEPVTGTVVRNSGEIAYLTTTAVWSPDGRYLAVGDNEITGSHVQVWDAQNLNLIALLR